MSNVGFIGLYESGGISCPSDFGKIVCTGEGAIDSTFYLRKETQVVGECGESVSQEYL